MDLKSGMSFDPVGTKLRMKTCSKTGSGRKAVRKSGWNMENWNGIVCVIWCIGALRMPCQQSCPVLQIASARPVTSSFATSECERRVGRSHPRRTEACTTRLWITVCRHITSALNSTYIIKRTNSHLIYKTQITLNWVSGIVDCFGETCHT